MNVAQGLSTMTSVAQSLIVAMRQNMDGARNYCPGAAEIILKHSLAFLQNVSANPVEVFDISENSLKQTVSLITTVSESAVLCPRRSVLQVSLLGSAATLCAGLATAVALRLAVNSAKLAAPEPPTGLSAALSVDAAKEVSSSCIRTLAHVCSVALSCASAHGQGQEALVLLQPLLTAYERLLAIHPTIFRRVIPDALLLSFACSTLHGHAASAGAGAGAGGEQGEIVIAQAGRLTAAALWTAYRYTGKQGGSSSTGPTPTLSSALRSFLEVHLPAHTTLLQAASTYAPHACPGAQETVGAWIGMLPQEGVAFAKPTESLASSVYSLGSDVPVPPGAPSVHLAAARALLICKALQAVIARPVVDGDMQAEVHKYTGVSSSACDSEQVVLPLPLLLSCCETLCDAPAAYCAPAVAVQAGAAAAAAQDSILAPALIRTCLTLQVAGLHLLALLCTSCPSPMRRYRTLAAGACHRVGVQICTGAGGTRAAAAVLGHAPALSLPITPEHLGQACMLSVLTSTWCTLLQHVGMGWCRAGEGASSCPEAQACMKLLPSVALASLTSMTGLQLCDRTWSPLSPGLVRAWGAEGAAGRAITLLHALVTGAASSMEDTLRFRIEQCALVLSSHWPGSVSAALPVLLPGEDGGAVPRGSGYAPLRGSGKGVAGGAPREDALPPQPKRSRQLPSDPIAALQQAIASATLPVGEGQVRNDADIMVAGLGGMGQGGTVDGCRLMVHLSKPVAASLASLCVSCATVPWAAGHASPLAQAHAQAAQALAHRYGLQLPTIATMGQQSVVVATVPVSLASLRQGSEPGTVDVAMDAVGAGHLGSAAGLAMAVSNSVRDSTSHAPSFGALSGSAASAQAPAPAPHIPMPVVMAVPHMSSGSTLTGGHGAPPAPMSEGDKARLAKYAEELGDEFPDF